MSTPIDLTGHKYGRLTVLHRAEDQALRSGRKNAVWRCRCECGREKNVRASHLRSGATTSCGCYHRQLLSETRCPDLVGKRFGKLVVVKKERHKDNVKWFCRCDCGNTTLVNTAQLISGNQKGCRCNIPGCGARLEYIRQHGDIPDDHIVVALDGNLRNTSPENLLAIAKRDHDRFYRNNLHSIKRADLKRIALNICALENAIMDAEDKL